MAKVLFFDNASTTRCSDAASELVRRYANEVYGNPHSSHSLGQEAARGMREAHVFFANAFGVEPPQVIFTGSGSEADNLAVYGVAMDWLTRSKTSHRIVTTQIEHPAVKGTVKSLEALGFETVFLPVDANAKIDEEEFIKALTPNTRLVSIQQVNNIVGAVLPVERLAQLAKKKLPEVIFHTDAIQAFCKVPHPKAPSPIDLVSVSGHKVHGPKGVGALIVLNRRLLKQGLRPLIWGGLQESGLRSGTQNAGLVSGFRAAADEVLAGRERFESHVRKLRDRLEKEIHARKLPVTWNSPKDAVPHIVSLSIPGYPSGPLAKLLEERGCMVSTGSACSSQKPEPDPVLTAMGLPLDISGSAIRVSFCETLTEQDVVALANALEESIALMSKLLGIDPVKGPAKRA